MAGFKSKKIYCMGVSRLSGLPCKAKGFPTNKFKGSIRIFKCRYHGSQNTNFFGFRDRANRGGFNKLGYSDDAKIKSLAKLKQFKDKPIEYVRQYYEDKVKTRIDKFGRYNSKYSARAFIRGKNTSKYKKGKNLADQLDCLLQHIKQTREQRNKIKS
jgi:hypothetical protein